MEYCEILFDLENIFDILIRAASWLNISSLRINTRRWIVLWLSTEMILRSIVSVDSHFYTYNKFFTINLGVDQPVLLRIVNEIIPVPDQQLMISIPNSKNTDQTILFFLSWRGSIKYWRRHKRIDREIGIIPYVSPVFTNGETHFLIPAKYFALISRRGFLSAPERIIFHITPLKHMLWSS